MCSMPYLYSKCNKYSMLFKIFKLTCFKLLSLLNFIFWQFLIFLNCNLEFVLSIEILAFKILTLIVYNLKEVC